MNSLFLTKDEFKAHFNYGLMKRSGYWTVRDGFLDFSAHWNRTDLMIQL